MKKQILVLFLSTFISCVYANNEKYVEQVIHRFSSKDIPLKISLSLDKENGLDCYETSVKNGIITVKASSGVAACRGFYEYVRSQGAGINSWSGNRFQLPEILPDMPVERNVSPFKHHYYLNVVTYGYTMPYWSWTRWQQEIDWMALHGIDMPLALVANEAISARVWKKLGLTDKEIADYFVGPAHLPWMRMGNISKVDGQLPQSWHKDQIKLQHKILERMRKLGMKPICPGFAGFVPESFKRVFPNVNIVETSWANGAFHNWMISPNDKMFVKVGKMFIEEWEKEFGKNNYYIADSFNEMDIPFPPKGSNERYELLADYGNNVYSSIKAGNPDAVWVMQGWMFGYQRDIWDYETLKALVSKVPDDKMLLLDLAVDYNKYLWKKGSNYDFYKGFYNKEWVYSVIPNMGGNSALIGVMEFYANGKLEALASPNKGNLSGYGMAPEGIENNEVLYELICDAGWTNNSINLDKWLENYTICRYGKAPAAIIDFWQEMRKSVYSDMVDHPRFNWQFRPGRYKKGLVCINDVFCKGVERLADAIPICGSSPLFGYDMVYMTSQYLGGKMDILIQAIEDAYSKNDESKALGLEKQFETLALATDRLLLSHPNLRMEKWIEDARTKGDTEILKNYYERNARRIVTIWGPPVYDYSARVWSGLIRDYYLPRWKNYFASKHTHKSFDFISWENDWVEKKTGLSEMQPYDNVLQTCKKLIEQYKNIKTDMILN